MNGWWHLARRARDLVLVAQRALGDGKEGTPLRLGLGLAAQRV